MKLLNWNVISHWHKSFGGFNTSSLDFYKSVEKAVRARGIPGVTFSRVHYAESSIVSAKREYLRVQREKLVFDICAAPFGKDFFFSWWLSHPMPSFGVLWAFLFLTGAAALLTLVFVVSVEVSCSLGFLLLFVIFPAVVWLLGRAVHQGKLGSEDAILLIPYVGAIYALLFKPPTYYKLDTTHMFQEAVHAAMLSVVEEVTTAKGLRVLSETERKPVSMTPTSA